MTLMMRPSVPSPTGTAIGWPVSDTSWPRTRPSVESMATVRTEFSPRCCATSSTSRLPRFLVSSALRIAGRCPSNCTSTTAPITWRTRPITLVAIVLSYFLVLLVPAFAAAAQSHDLLQRLGAGDDLDQLLGDVGLARRGCSASSACRSCRRRCAWRCPWRSCARPARRPRSPAGRGRSGWRCCAAAGSSGSRSRPARTRRRPPALVGAVGAAALGQLGRDQLQRGRLLRDHRLELGEIERGDVELAGLEQGQHLVGDVGRVGEADLLARP